MFRNLRNLLLVAVVLIVIAVVIRVATIGGTGSSSTAAATGTQETSVVDQGDVAITVSATGSIQAKQNVSLTFSTSGRVVTINVNEGDHVLKGQIIATLDPQSLQDSLLLAQAKVDSQNISLRKLTEKPRDVDVLVYRTALAYAKASLKESYTGGPDAKQIKINEINLSTAKNSLWEQQLTRDADRKQKEDLQKDARTASQANSLPSENSENASINAKDYDIKIAQAKLDAEKSKSADAGSIASAQASVTSAQINLDKLLKGGTEQEIAQAQANLKSAQAAFEDAKTSLNKTRLLAPFDGVIAQLNLHVGQQTPAGAAAIILDTSSFYVDLPIDEVDISKIAEGQTVTLKFDALPKVVLQGKVTRIAAIGSKSGDAVTYTIRVDIDPANQPLLSTMSTTASIITGQATNVVRVRNRFIRNDRSAGKSYASVRQVDGTFKEVEVTLGIHNDTYTEIKSGLAVGAIVTLPQTQSTLPGPGQGNQNAPGQ